MQMTARMSQEVMNNKKNIRLQAVQSQIHVSTSKQSKFKNYLKQKLMEEFKFIYQVNHATPERTL